jgi:hypothetical protein
LVVVRSSRAKSVTSPVALVTGTSTLERPYASAPLKVTLFIPA